MDRRQFLAASLSALAGPLTAGAQSPGKAFRVGMLWLSEPPEVAPHSGAVPLYNALLDGLRELGYVEGRNLVVVARWASLRPDRIPELARDLVRVKVDVIVTTGDGEVRAARQATDTIPIVMGVSGDPVGAGYVASLARPGGNVTGLSYLSLDVNPKLIEALKEAMPTLTRLAVVWNVDNPVKKLDFDEASAAARRLGVLVESMSVRRSSDLDTAFAAIAPVRPQAILTLVDEVMNQDETRQAVIKLAVRHRLPAVAADRRHVADGALMSYGPSLVGMFRRAAVFVDRILKGAHPSTLPVEQPRQFELVINLKAAKALALTIPPALLLRADQVLE
jgi:putative tryptophan/tyrosine transport system substrate-binding protein